MEEVPTSHVERDKQVVKKRRKRKKKPMPESDNNIGLASTLNDLKEDILYSSKSISDLNDTTANETYVNPAESSTMYSNPANINIRSETNNSLYIEKRGKFSTTTKEMYIKKLTNVKQRNADSASAALPHLTTRQLAMNSHRVFRTVSLFCHGLLAGVAVWHSVMVFNLSSVNYQPLKTYYSDLALPVQSMYYFLLTICMVSVFDRYDIGRPTKRTIIRALTFQSGAISILLYTFSLIVTVALAAVDFRISLPSQNDESELNIWRALSLARAVSIVLSWFFVSIKPSTDTLTKHLFKSDRSESLSTKLNA